MIGAQVLSLALMPVLTRLYPVESFGYFAIFIAAANLIGAFSTLRLEMTIPIAADQEEANQMSSITAGFSLAAGVVFGLLFLFPQVRALLPSMDQAWQTWFLIALSAVLVGWIQILTQRVLRAGNFRVAALRHILDKGLFIVAALLAAKLKFTVSGLILAQTLGYSISVLVLFWGCAWLPSIHLGDVRRLAKKYSDFPRLNTMSVGFQLISTQLPILLYSNYFPVAEIGFLNLAQRLAELPNTIMTSALASVYYRRILSAAREQSRRIFLRTTLWTAIALIVPSLILAFWAGPLIRIVFGAKWELSAPFLLALLPLTITRLNYVLQQSWLLIMRRLDLDLKVSALVLMAQILGMGVGIYYFSTLLAPVVLASALTSVVYLLGLAWVYREIK